MLLALRGVGAIVDPQDAHGVRVVALGSARRRKVRGSGCSSAAVTPGWMISSHVARTP
ncbi:hypothetical protein [Amycolatopsis sp. FDAARGOS 1241]|uniref:hypothetical protein n=1 Tax=Amycolatopsis sp. FDAARGOS 1241 TaxID=2778070 RepID=UPI001EF3B145|nr:hypothetical protein [Amycolatopsis sp. FDAARGOS 1241]